MDETMQDFALITEGPMDHAILTNLLVGFFEGQGEREPEVNPLHPESLAERRQGGWTLVLEYLREKKFRDALRSNKYLIVQVDTDVSEDKGFDVPKRDENGPLSTEALIGKVVERLQKEIGETDWTANGHRFIFAIGVEQLEYWVLPLWFHDAKGKQIANCTVRLGGSPQLRNKLKARNFPWITKSEKNYNSYDLASEGYQKRNILLKEGARSPSLKIFLDEMDRRQIRLIQED